MIYTGEGDFHSIYREKLKPSKKVTNIRNPKIANIRNEIKVLKSGEISGPEIYPMFSPKVAFGKDPY